MKKGYWVVAYRSISDPSAAQAYSKFAGPYVQASGGKPLVRTSDEVEAFEAGIKARTVIIEFESYEKALAAYNTAEYQAAVKALACGVERDFRIVAGV